MIPTPDADLTARRAAACLGGLYFGSVAVRWLLSAFVPSPIILTDELFYLEMARSIPEGGGLRWGEAPMNFPSWIYPLLLAPFADTDPMSRGLGAIRLLNAALMSLTLLFTYALAREMTTRKRALLAAALASAAPALCYSATFMAENVHLPAFTLCMWLALRAIDRPTLFNRVAAGLAFGLALHAKPHGVFAPMTYALSVVTFELGLLRGGGPWAPRLGAYALAVVRHGVTALAYLAAVAPRAYLATKFEGAGSVLSVSALLGGYSSFATESRSAALLPFAGVVLAILAVWTLSVGLLPALCLAEQLKKAARGDCERRRAILAIMTGWLTVFLTMLLARHTLLIDASWVVHERIMIITVPPALALFCAAAPLAPASERSRAVRNFIRFAAVPGMLAAWVIVARTSTWNLPTSTPSLSGYLPLALEGQTFPALQISHGLVLAAAAGFFIYAARRPRLQGAGVGAVLIAATAGWYVTQQFINQRVVGPYQQLASEIDDAVPEGHELFVLRDGLLDQRALSISFHNPGRTVYLAPENKTYYSRPLALDEQGTVMSGGSARDRWLLASADFRFDRSPGRYFDDLALFRLTPERPLRIDLASSFVEASELDTPEKLETFFSEFPLTIVKSEIPGAIARGREREVRLTLRNDGEFALPAGAPRLAFGYHWSDPERSGSWESIVWDDGARGYLPPGLEPGRTGEVLLMVSGDELEPGNRWLLTIVLMRPHPDPAAWSPRSEHRVMGYVAIER